LSGEDFISVGGCLIFPNSLSLAMIWSQAGFFLILCPAKRLRCFYVHENPDPEIRRFPDVLTEYLGWKESAFLGNDGDVVLEQGLECLKCMGNADDIRLIPKVIGGIPKVNKGGGVKMAKGNRHNLFD